MIGLPVIVFGSCNAIHLVVFLMCFWFHFYFVAAPRKPDFNLIFSRLKTAFHCTNTGYQITMRSYQNDGCKTNIHWIKKPVERKENLTIKWGIYLLSTVIQAKRLLGLTQLGWIMTQRKHKKVKNPVLWEADVLDSQKLANSTLCYAICSKFSSFLQKLIFLSVSSSSLPEMEFFQVFLL